MGANETRNVFFNAVCNFMKDNKDVVIVSVDLAGPPFDKIRADFPDRYISVGIAEQNAIAVGCGLAAAGKKVVIYAANPFIIFRAFDQIRNGVCMMDLPVNIVGLGTGFSVAECGATHMDLEDIAITSLCPNLKTVSISDNRLAIAAARQILTNNHPCYYRFGKWSGSTLSEESPDFSLGFRTVKRGTDVAIVSTGCSVKLLAEMNFQDEDPEIIDVFSIPFNSTAFLDKIKGFQGVIAYEEQIQRGGLGSILLEITNDSGFYIPVKRMGVKLKDGYPQVFGGRDYWLHEYKLDEPEVIKVIKSLKMKQKSSKGAGSNEE